MTTYYPKKKYDIATKFELKRTSDHEDRVYIHFASDYMPPIPKYEKVNLKKSVGISNFFKIILP